MCLGSRVVRHLWGIASSIADDLTLSTVQAANGQGRGPATAATHGWRHAGRSQRLAPAGAGGSCVPPHSGPQHPHLPSHSSTSYIAWQQHWRQGRASH